MDWYMASTLGTLTESVLGLHHALDKAEERTPYAPSWEENAAAWAKLAAHCVNELDRRIG
jgi:hypothetical protein